MSTLSYGMLPAEDVKYIGILIVAQTGISQEDAGKRVADIFDRIQSKAKVSETAARNMADKARKASAYASIWNFVSSVLGAFIAGPAATYGGRQCDLSCQLNKLEKKCAQAFRFSSVFPFRSSSRFRFLRIDRNLNLMEKLTCQLQTKKYLRKRPGRP